MCRNLCSSQGCSGSLFHSFVAPWQRAERSELCQTLGKLQSHDICSRVTQFRMFMLLASQGDIWHFSLTSTVLAECKKGKGYSGKFLINWQIVCTEGCLVISLSWNSRIPPMLIMAKCKDSKTAEITMTDYNSHHYLSLLISSLNLYNSMNLILSQFSNELLGVQRS